MNDEQIERRIEFIVEQQAQFCSRHSADKREARGGSQAMARET